MHADRIATRQPGMLAVSAATLIASVADGLCLLDGEGRITALNPAAEALLGCPAGELLGRDAHATLQPRDIDGEPLARSDSALLGVLATGRAVRVESDAFTRADGTRLDVAYTVSPVTADGATTGAVVNFRDIGERRAVERRLAELDAERREIAAELQNALLPEALPEVDGLEFGVAFRPVGSQVLVGGDFYDVVPSGEGHLALLGDVRGKGAGAAAVAGMARYLLRGAASGGADIPAMIALLNRELLHHASGRFVTLAAAHVVKGPDGVVRATVACAGHPRPVLLRADGSSDAVGGSGALVGVVDALAIDVEEVTLAPGDALVLYSDGLMDVGRHRGLPPFDVQAALAGMTAAGSAELVTRLEQAAGVPAVAEPPDDIAILAVRVTPVHAPAVGGAPPTVGAAPADPVEIGQVESGFRAANEQIVSGRPDAEPSVAVTCECGHEACTEIVTLPRAAYEAVRGRAGDDPGAPVDTGRCFVVVPGHEIPRTEKVIERRGDYVVVRKLGSAGDAADALASDA